MKSFYTAASVAALTLCLAVPAGAVDIMDPRYGDDMENTSLTITENGQSRTLVLMNGEILYDVCSSECTIQPAGGKAVTASNYDMVEVAGSSAKVTKFDQSFASAYPQLALLPPEPESEDSADALASPEFSPEGEAGEDGDGGAGEN